MTRHDWTRKLGFWETIGILIPVGLLLWALAKGYGPPMVFIALGATVVVSGLRFLISLWRLLF